jgi:hypothetical protein
VATWRSVPVLPAAASDAAQRGQHGEAENGVEIVAGPVIDYLSQLATPLGVRRRVRRRARNEAAPAAATADR